MAESAFLAFAKCLSQSSDFFLSFLEQSQGCSYYLARRTVSAFRQLLGNELVKVSA